MNMSYNDDGTLGYSFDDYNFSNGGSGIDWGSTINQGFGLASQIVGAWGRNPTQQVMAGGQPIGGGYSPAAQLAGQAQVQSAIASQQTALRAGNSQTNGGGLGLDDAAGSITGFITRNPLLVAGGALGVYLLMREPPRSRR